ncbi:MAG: DDE-type integrase/transposase/recombinase, partial [Flavobacteriales bacterium]|nr:DDE-type integrase/transposase/recombinase [Flavobacteriales bacterium]
MPKNVVARIGDMNSCTTLAGSLNSNRFVTLNRTCFPEFYKSKFIDRINAKVFDNPAVRYDMIIGRDVLREMGVNVDFAKQKMTWDEVSIEMRVFPSDNIDKSSVNKLSVQEQMFLETLEADLEDDETVPTVASTEFDDDDDFLNDDLEEFEKGNDHAVMSAEDEDEVYLEDEDDEAKAEGYKSKKIMSSKYEGTDATAVCRSCTHLSLDKQNDLREVLEKYEKLFSPELGKYVGEKIHLDIDPSVDPHRSRPYTVPHQHQGVFKEELDRLVKIGVLEEAGRSEWIAGTFIIPKKDGRIRWISDFRGLNKTIKRKVYPIPRIADILGRRKNYEFLSKLDISMQYYTFELDDESSELCTIATPFGLYKYRRLPMGISQSPDIAQEIMERILRAVKDIEIYIDDIGIFSPDWHSHLEALDQVLKILEDNGFTVNPLKCEWAVKETDFLGHWLTPTGVKPWKKKVDAILKMEAPTTIKELRSFLGLVTYYRDMWPRRSHVLAPLTELLGTKKFEWGINQQRAFEQMKAIAAAETLLAYPDHNLPFHIETDASDYQLGGVIKQQGKIVAYYSRKLNSAQKNYTTIEKELFSVVEILREYRSMLLGARIHVYTDHKNLTHKLTAFQTQRVMRWRLLLEAMSRVPTSRVNRSIPDKDPLEFASDGCYSLVEEREMAECLMEWPIDEIYQDAFLEHPKFDEQGRYPFNFKTISEYQEQSSDLQDQLKENPKLFHTMRAGDSKLICFRQNDADKIVLTKQMLPKVVDFYHKAMAHVEGRERLEQTIKTHFYHRNIHAEVHKQISECEACALNKRGRRTYGESGARDALVMPWQEVHCDTIGPWKIELRARSLEFNAMTMVDPSTNLLEIAPIIRRTDEEGSAVVENTWFARYPRPLKVVTDNGPEFGQKFTDMVEKNGAVHRASTSRNPQGNYMIERTHQAIGQVLRTVVTSRDPKTVHEANAVIAEVLATAMHAYNCSVQGTNGYLSPGALAFKRDMYMDIPLIADILAIQRNRQNLIDKRLLRANAKRVKYEYTVDDMVYKKNYIGLSDKLKKTATGPHKITRVHTNGTVTIQLSPNVFERINIRRIFPKFPLKPR